MKKQTIEEWLAAGNTITKVPPAEPKDGKPCVTVRSTGKVPLVPMHITEGAVLFAERTRRRKKERKFTGDVNLLPPKLVEFLKAKGKL